MIEKEEREFGPFGTGVDPIFRAKKKRKIRGAIFLVLAFVLVPIAAYFGQHVYKNYFENEIPKIEVAKAPEGVGLSPSSFELKISDERSGISEISIRYEQNRKVRKLKTIRLKERGVREYSVPIELDGKKLGLRQGEVKFSAVAFDHSMLSNKKELNFSLKVDYTKPIVEVVTSQHNATHGGAQLVFYKIRDDSKKFVGFSGIKMGSWLFPGFPAKNLDKSFSGHPELYFAFFPIPLDYNPEKEKVKIFARDAVGNFSTSGFSYRIAGLRTKKFSQELTPSFLDEVVEGLYQKYSSRLPEEDPSSVGTIQSLVSRFRILNVEFRREVESEISELLSKPRMTRYWSGKFVRQAGFVRRHSFGDLLTFTFEGLSGGSHLSGGVGFAARAGREVRAANDGIVVFASDLGPYGKAVFIDHGFGLSTMYANLAAISVEEGQRVGRGKTIGTAGRSGLYERTGLHYEVRLHGVPVRPEEWWDSKWIEGHVDKKLDSVKKSLGIRIKKKV